MRVFELNFIDLDRFEVLLDQSLAAKVLAGEVLAPSHL